MTAEEFLLNLAKQGGRIVSTNDLTVFEIAGARACDRLFVDQNGFGFVYFPPVNNVLPFPNREVKTT